MMEQLPKYMIVPVVDTEDAHSSAMFLSSLYPKLDQFTIILCYFYPHLPPIYEDVSALPLVAARRHELLLEREATARRVLQSARAALVDAGFLNENILEFVQEKGQSVAMQTCNLADVRMVDAVLVHKRVSSSLEGFLRGDSTSALIQHCLASPVWFVDGTIRADHAAVCIASGEDSLRAVDHAAFMLAETRARITLLHISPAAKEEIACPGLGGSSELERWKASRAGKRMKGFLEKACELLEREGIEQERIRIVIVPRKGRLAHEILSYCRAQQIGIAVLAHTERTGLWGSIKRSVTKALLAEFKDMSIWVTQ